MSMFFCTTIKVWINISFERSMIEMKKKWPLLASSLFATGMIAAGCSGAEDPAPPANDPGTEEQAPTENQVPENNGNNLGDPNTNDGNMDGGGTNDGTSNGGTTDGGTNGEMNDDVEAPEDGGLNGEEFETED
jgi:hypothetical protein